MLRMLALSLLALLLLAPSASARVELTDHHPVIVPTAVDAHVGGDRALDVSDESRIVAYPLGGGRPQTLARLPAFGPRDAYTATLLDDATSDFIALNQFWEDTPSDGQRGATTFAIRTVVGPHGGPFTTISGCGELPGPGASLDGDQIAYTQDPSYSERPCEETQPPRAPAAGVVIRQVGAGDTLRGFVPEGDEQIHGPITLRGRYIAYTLRRGGEASAIVVRDWQAGREIVRVDGEGSVALQADGTAIIIRGRTTGAGRCTLLAAYTTVHTPAQPEGRLLPYAPCYAPIRLENDRVYFTREAAGEGHYAEVAIGDLHGNARAVDRVVSGALVDAEGGRVIAADRTCAGAGLYAEDAEALEPPPIQEPSCRIELQPARTLRVGLSRRVTIPYRCDEGCTGEVGIKAAGDVARSVGARRGAGRGKASLYLGGPVVRRLRSGRRVTARVTAVYRDRFGRERRTARRVTLVARR